MLPFSACEYATLRLCELPKRSRSLGKATALDPCFCFWCGVSQTGKRWQVRPKKGKNDVVRVRSTKRGAQSIAKNRVHASTWTCSSAYIVCNDKARALEQIHSPSPRRLGRSKDLERKVEAGARNIKIQIQFYYYFVGKARVRRNRALGRAWADLQQPLNATIPRSGQYCCASIAVGGRIGSGIACLSFVHWPLCSFCNSSRLLPILVAAEVVVAYAIHE